MRVDAGRTTNPSGLSVIRSTRRRAYGTGMTLDRAAIDAKKALLPATAAGSWEEVNPTRLERARSAIQRAHAEWDVQETSNAKNAVFARDVFAAERLIEYAERRLRHPRLKRPTTISLREAQLAEARENLDHIKAAGPQPLPRGHTLRYDDGADDVPSPGVYVRRDPVRAWARQVQLYAADANLGRWIEVTIAGDDEEAHAELLAFLWDAQKRREERDRDRSPWRPSLVGD